MGAEDAIVGAVRWFFGGPPRHWAARVAIYVAVLTMGVGVGANPAVLAGAVFAVRWIGSRTLERRRGEEYEQVGPGYGGQLRR